MDVERGFGKEKNLATYVVVSAYFGGMFGVETVCSAYINNGEFLYDPGTQFSGIAAPEILNRIDPRTVKADLLKIIFS